LPDINKLIIDKAQISRKYQGISGLVQSGFKPSCAFDCTPFAHKTPETRMSIG
jgi:hypothetical protein